MKYIYEGISMKEYCRLNNISYDVIIARIRRNKEQNPYLSIDELVYQAINYEKLPKNTKYEYKDGLLIDYCRDKNIKPQTMYSRIGILKKDNPDMSTDELIEKSVNGTWKKGNRTKYYYQGKSLKEYCVENGIKYHSIVKKIDRLKEKYEVFSDNQLVLIALGDLTVKDALTSKMIKYFKTKRYLDLDIKKYVDSINNPINYNKNKIDLLIKRKTK